MNMKKGTKFMIDNRDNRKHEFALGTKKYQLAAYDFAIITTQKIGTFAITCDGNARASVGIQN